MDFLVLLFAIPLFFAIFGIISGLWRFYDLWRFTQFQGKMKRGVIVGTLPLKAEIYQFLTTLEMVTQYHRYFIYKTGQEFVLVEKRPFSFTLIDSIFYIAYIDLSESEKKIEFRMPLSYLITWITSPLFFLVFWFGFFFSFRIAFEFAFIWFVPAILLTLWLAGMLFSHYYAIKRLLQGLNQLREQGNS